MKKKMLQDVMLEFTGTKINPSDIKQVIINQENGKDIYITQLKCYYKKEIHSKYFVKCAIDLSNVPSGLYIIIMLIYNNRHYAIHHMLPFLVQEDDSDKPLELLEVYTNITEYKYCQKIKLLFSKRLQILYTSYRIMFSNDRDEKFNIPLTCDYGPSMRLFECEGNFDKIRAGKYLISEIFSYGATVYPTKNFYLNVKATKETKLELLSIKGKINQRWSLLNLIFNKEINAGSISKFSLYNETLLYDLYTLNINQISETTISANFDFTHIPKGGYYLGMLYKGDEYIFSDIFLNITKKY
jgi:hypothetical protein